MNFGDRCRVVRSGLVHYESMPCSFSPTDAFGLVGWQGVQTEQSTDKAVRGTLRVPNTLPLWPEGSFNGSDYSILILAPAVYADMRWAVENRRIFRNHVAYLLRQA